MNTPPKAFGGTIAVLLLNALLLVTAVPSARADDRDKCRRQIEKIEERLNHEVARHGEHSPQAESRRRQLREERERCWNHYHSWWNGSDHQWHTERDWEQR